MRLSNRLILASGSPRRKQLLQDAGFDFEVKTVPFEEVFPEDMASEKVAEFLAIGKNEAHRKALENELIILTADTVVVFNDQILGKPKDEREAINTLNLLSGEIHDVITGVCISLLELQHSFSCKTQVKFKSLSDKEIKLYVENYKPMDKAGSYAIQEWIGLIGIEWINGSYYNVVGLPVHEVYQLLKDKFS
ncbi:MAG: Maf family nucleotide pyrophosphatase [Bacteroidota bacterium]